MILIQWIWGGAWESAFPISPGDTHTAPRTTPGIIQLQTDVLIFSEKPSQPAWTGSSFLPHTITTQHICHMQLSPPLQQCLWVITWLFPSPGVHSMLAFAHFSAMASKNILKWMNKYINPKMSLLFNFLVFLLEKLIWGTNYGILINCKMSLLCSQLLWNKISIHY